MKVSGLTPSYIQSLKTKREDSIKLPTIIATGVGIDIRSKGTFESVIKDNNPDDPIVSKKVLDALSLNLIKFNQREREALSAILGGKAKTVRESRA
ncbi:MAG: hypothetical protein KAG61_00195 [Bacteriovoracaceae bacterium]|nr:hypothetical protein [Bacteriovoracaceae bacterium]